MSESVSRPDGADLRRSIKRAVETHDSVTVDELVTDVASKEGCAEAAVVDEIDKMDQHGFLYLRGSEAGESQEVRLP